MTASATFPAGSTVYVVDDDLALQRALCRLIESTGLKTQMYDSAQPFLESYDPQGPGCLLLDLRLAGMSGVELQSRLVERGVQLPIIIITGHADVPTAVKTMGLGAFDFFEKPFDGQALLDRIADALAFDAEDKARTEQRSSVEARLAKLSPRERQVLDLVVAGHLNKQIAVELEVSSKTVEAHRASITRKLEVGNVASLITLVLGHRSPESDDKDRTDQP